MQGYQAMQATAQTAWQSGSDSLSNTSTGETTWKFVWQTLTNTNSSNSKSSNLRQSSGDLSVGNGISWYTADSPRHCWQPLSGLRRLRTRPWPLEGNRWHSSARLCISKHSTRLSALVCVCVSSKKLLILNLNNKHLKSTFCEGCRAVFLVNLWLVDLHGKVPGVIKRELKPTPITLKYLKIHQNALL